MQDEIPTEEMPITPQMEEYFRAFLQKHIDLVEGNARMLMELGQITPELYEYIRNTHDRSKLEEPEYTPYVKRKWLERDGKGEKYREMGDDVKQAIVHHVTTNAHHPECWSDEIIVLLWKFARVLVAKNLHCSRAICSTSINLMLCARAGKSKDDLT